MAPHIPLGEKIGHIGCADQADGRSADCAQYGNQGGVAQVLYLEDLRIILEVDTMREQSDLIEIHHFLVADRADEEVVEGIEADQRDNAEHDDSHDIVCQIAWGHLDLVFRF